MKRLQDMGLIIIGSDVFGIADRLKCYDPELVLCYNERKKEYQVWTQGGACAAISDRLDAELIEKVMRADGRTSYGMRAKLDELKAQREYDEQRERIDAHDSAKAMHSELIGLDKGRKSFAM